MVRTAECACGALKVSVEGEPAVVGACCCLQCQRRTGSVFGVAAYFPKDKVEIVAGESKIFTRTGKEGTVSIHFCLTCGSSLFSEASVFPGIRAVMVGCFADPSFAPPELVGWHSRNHAWVKFPPNIPIIDVQLSQTEIEEVFKNF